MRLYIRAVAATVDGRNLESVWTQDNQNAENLQSVQSCETFENPQIDADDYRCDG